jgi:hypothetical protein
MPSNARWYNPTMRTTTLLIPTQLRESTASINRSAAITTGVAAFVANPALLGQGITQRALAGTAMTTPTKVTCTLGPDTHTQIDQLCSFTDLSKNQIAALALEWVLQAR